MQFLCKNSNEISIQAIKNSIKKLQMIFILVTCLLFCETTMFSNVVAEVPTRHQIYYQVQVVPIFERVVHIHQKSAEFQNAKRLTGDKFQIEIFFHS